MHVCGNGLVHGCGVGCMSIKRLGACMRSWVHVYETVGCRYADAGRMSMERLGACMRMLDASMGVGSSPKLPSGPWHPGPPHPPPWFLPKPKPSQDIGINKQLPTSCWVVRLFQLKWWAINDHDCHRNDVSHVTQIEYKKKLFNI